MDGRETELSRFRQQWQAEVTARTRAPASTPKKPPTRTSTRRLSHSAPDGEDSTPRPRDRSASPVAEVDAPESALEHYEMAAEKETQGSLGESLSLYRKAFRMDAKVDSQYREKYFSRAPLTAGASNGKGKENENEHEHEKPASTASHPNALPSLLATNSTTIATLIASFAHLSIPPALPPSIEGADPEPPFSPLTTLPSELLLHILRDLALADVASFARCAQVCKALAFLVVTEQGIWHDICTVTYKRMVWDWKVDINGNELHRTLNSTSEEDPPPDSSSVEVDETRTIPTDDEVIKTYHNNWRKMFHTRPRIRFNGVYISTCNYVRSGASQSGWNTPVHIVTYYRYLRFYPDGTALSLLSTDEPGAVVHGFSKPALTPAHLRNGQVGGALPGWARYVSRGRWRVDSVGRVDVETVPRGMDNYLFRMQFDIKSVRTGGRWSGSNKLVWEGFWSLNSLTDDLAEFSLRNDKAFFFSRVGSIERELGIL